jgi:hypothetical protein
VASGESAAVISHMRTAIGEMLREALDERGFTLPLHLAMTGANGGEIHVRYVAGDETLESRVVALSRTGGHPPVLMPARSLGRALLECPIALTLNDGTGRSMFLEYRSAMRRN